MKGLSTVPAHKKGAPGLLLIAVVMALYAGAGLAAPTPQPVSLSGMLQGAQGASAQVTGHYSSDNGRGFVFDLSAPRPLLRFDGSMEMWVLTPSQGPRGDTLYKNDMGQTMLRVARIGGMTVYPPHNSKGMAASFDRSVPQLGLFEIRDLGTFAVRSQRAVLDIKRVLPNLDGITLSNEVPVDKLSKWTPLLVDASNLLAETLARLAIDPKQRKTTDRIHDVQIVFADAPAVKFRDGLLLVQVAPLKGLEGRPSSLKIEQALGIR